MDGRSNSNTTSSDDYVLEVRPNDVLFGRGSGPNDHEGNIRFRELVAHRKDEYLATNHRQTKAKIAKEIVDQVFTVNGRFLKKLEGNELTQLGFGQGQDVYQVAGDDMIMEKAKQALRQNRNRDAAGGSEGGGGGGTSPKPPSHAAMASVSPIFQQTLQQYGNDAELEVATETNTAAATTAGYQEALMQQRQQQLFNNNAAEINPLMIPSNSCNMYGQQQQLLLQQQQQPRSWQQQHYQEHQEQAQKHVYSLDNDGYATYTEILEDPDDNHQYFYNSNRTGGGTGGGIGRLGRSTTATTTTNGNGLYGMAADAASGGGGTAAAVPTAIDPSSSSLSSGRSNMMMMQSTGNARRGSALLGGRKSDISSSSTGGGGVGNRRESLRIDEIWRRDSMLGSLQAQSMQMSELMESFRGMSATLDQMQMNTSMDTIGTIDNFGSLGGAAGASTYNMSGMSNMSAMSIGSIFKTTPDTPSSDGKNGLGGSHHSNSTDQSSDDGSGQQETSSAPFRSSSKAYTPVRKVDRTNSGDVSLGGADLWNSKHMSALMEEPLDNSTAIGAASSPQTSRHVESLMHASIESSSYLDVSTSLLATGETGSSSQDQSFQRAYSGQIVPSVSKRDST